MPQQHRPVERAGKLLVAHVEQRLAAACAQYVESTKGDPPVLEQGVERALVVLPLFHIYSLSVNMLLGMRLGALLVLHTRFELDAADGMTKVLVFRTRVKNRDVEGIDMVRFDEAGMVRDLTVMVRPRSSMERLLAEVQPRLMASLQADAGG